MKEMEEPSPRREKPVFSVVPRDVLRRLYHLVEGLEDRGPRDEGWQSEQLLADLAVICLECEGTGRKKENAQTGGLPATEGRPSQVPSSADKARLWDEIFHAIWERSETKTGWVLLGDHVMAVLEEKGVVVNPKSISPQNSPDNRRGASG